MVRRSPYQSEAEKSSSHSEYVLYYFQAFLWCHWALQVRFVLRCCVFMRNVCAGPKESNLQTGRNWHPLKRVYLCGSGHTGGCNWGAGSVQAHQFGGEYQLADMRVDVWLTSDSLNYFHTDISVGTQIPASCQADQVIRLQGNGVRKMNSYSYGDHYAHIKIRVPK